MHLAHSFTYKYAWMDATDAMHACMHILRRQWVGETGRNLPLTLAARTRGGSRIINLRACVREVGGKVGKVWRRAAYCVGSAACVMTRKV